MKRKLKILERFKSCCSRRREEADPSEKISIATPSAKFARFGFITNQAPHSHSHAMKTNSATPLLLSIITAISLNLNQRSSAQTPTPAVPGKVGEKEAPKKTEATSKPGPAAQKPLPADPEEQFKALFTNAYLSGRWAPLKDGTLGEERSGDKYQIVSVTKGSGDNWTVNAKMKYRDQEIVMPIPVQMKFAGDTAILVVDNLVIPGGGTYTARLLIYERTYSGTWKGQRGGGMLYGVITNDAE
jgi:hypothetical protein